MDDFDWLPTECADERYPMQLIAGLLECDGGQIVRVPAGKIINQGWGEVGSRRLVGAPRKPVPERLTLAWFSYTEDRFFAGSLELPQAELTRLFRAGFREPGTGKRVTWSKIIVGMGLGGWASVWLAGSGLVREVATAVLEPEEIDWVDVLDNPDIARADYLRSVLQSRLSRVQLRALAEDGPPVSTWPRYARREPWRALVEGLQVPLNMFVRGFNGERSYHDFAKQAPQDTLSAVPKRMQITWLTRSRTRLLSDIRLDEAELFEAFDRARAPTPDAAAPSLRVELGARGRISLSLETPAGRLPLTRSSAELLSLAG